MEDNTVLGQWVTENKLSENDKLFNWVIGIGDKYLYSVSGVAIPIFGDIPEFSLQEMNLIDKEWDKTDKSKFEVTQLGARELKDHILENIKKWKIQ